MMKALIWREIRGYIRSRIFAFSVIITLLGLIVLTWHPKDNPLFSFLYNNLSISLIIYVLFLLSWHLLQDKQTGEIQWLLMLPVSKVQIYISKYIAGLVLSVCFAIVFSIALTVIHVESWELLSVFILSTFGYSFGFIVEYIMIIGFFGFEITSLGKR